MIPPSITTPHLATEDRRGAPVGLLPLPPATLEVLLPFLADAILTAASTGDSRWGCTYHDNSSLVVHVGRTAMLTIQGDELLLIVDGVVLGDTALPAGVRLTRTRERKKSYHANLPRSVLATVPLSLLPRLEQSLRALQGAHRRAIATARRHSTTPSIRATHSQWAVDQIGLATGIDLPDPGHVNDRASDSATPEQGFELMEGALWQVVSSQYERNPLARRQCVEHHGAQCAVCGFRFEDAFGAIGEGFIHVHHIEPLAARKGGYVVDPIHDLVPVCPNCHAMLHRVTPPYSVAELRALRGDLEDEAKGMEADL